LTHLVKHIEYANSLIKCVENLHPETHTHIGTCTHTHTHSHTCTHEHTHTHTHTQREGVKWPHSFRRALQIL